MTLNSQMPAGANGRPRGQGKLRTIAKILSIVFIGLLSLVAAWNVIATYHQKNNLEADLLEQNEEVERLIHVALDGLLINLSVLDFQLHNDGTFPTASYIASHAAASGQPLLAYSPETIAIKTSADISVEGLAGMDFPDIERVHVWSGYICLLAEGYDPAIHSYEDVITPGAPNDFAIVNRVSLPRLGTILGVLLTVEDSKEEIRCHP